MSPSRESTPRQSGEERRAQLIDVAMREFAHHGYHGASTSAIAKRAGISQPYIYALFTDKRELFLAVHEHVGQVIREAFLAAAEGVNDPDGALREMGLAYRRLMGDEDLLLFQFQAYAAAGDDELRAPVAAGYTELFDQIRRVTGASSERVAEFFATGTFLTVAHALRLPPRCWPAPFS